MVVGIDEVGRGPWAGPLVFGAVVLGDVSIKGLTDSKKLTKKRREVLAVEVNKYASAVGIGWVSSQELDEVGMSEALRAGCRRALEQIMVPYGQIILDGTVNFLSDTGKGPYVTTMAKADLLVPSVSAASIVAKVARDKFMASQDDTYPGYGFAQHSGYGTVSHREAIARLGVTPLHRLSFEPLKKYATTQANDAAPKSGSSNELTRTIGNRGEDAECKYLVRSGYKVVDRNWKTKACEIDIIAFKSGVMHFVEVKYRKNTEQGGGIAAITPQKLKHMTRAAQIWMQRNGETDACLSAIEVVGEDYQVSNFVERV